MDSGHTVASRGRFWIGTPRHLAGTALDKGLDIHLLFSNQGLKTEGRMD